MQGIVILTSDERAYRVGNVVETRGIEFPPVAPNTTYIIHGVKVTEKEIKRWTDVVSYRMVFVIDKLPKLSKKIKEEIIVGSGHDVSLGQPYSCVHRNEQEPNPYTSRIVFPTQE